MLRLTLIVAGSLWLCPAFLAAPLRPTGAVEGREVVVRVGPQKLAASLENAVLRFVGPGVDISLTPNLQQGDGWVQPARAPAPPRWKRSRDLVRVQVVYPVSEDREFSLELTACSGLPAVFVTSRLAVQRSPRAQYYYWQSTLSAGHYVAPDAAGPGPVAFQTSTWDSIPWREWWLIPCGERSVAFLPTTVAGRAPGENGGLFLHALPRSNLLDPATTLDVSFGLATVADAAAAVALAAAARQRPVLALQPGRSSSPEVDYGRPAPVWLREAELYNLYYRDKAQWTETNVADKLQGFPFIIGSTPDKAALDRCHARGVKLLHYVVCTCLLDTEHQVREGGRVYSEWSESLDCETRDLKDHPDWVCIDQKGEIQHDAWGQSFHHPGLLNTCLHQPGLREAAVRQVRMLMELGYDGVFVDLAGPTAECYGPQFGKHAHAHPDWTNTQAYEEVLKALYAEVKRHGDDRVLIQNTCTGILPSHWADCDAQMLEAFPYGAETAQLRAPWPELQWHLQRQVEALQHGKVVVILPYFGKGTSEEIRRAALLSRAYGAMAGFLWADALGLRDRADTGPLAEAVYEIRLGRPDGPVRQEGGVCFRFFAQGVAVLNPQPWPVTVRLPDPGPGALADVGHALSVQAEGGVLRLDLAPESGRLLVRPTPEPASRTGAD